ncbi:MAG TPA: YciI family protein [Mycobacteriales bacterium]|nr:YciI family protein [Mycobacteriales bacterium]
MIMMFGSAGEMMETQSPEWITEMIAFMRDLDKELVEAGEMVFNEGLQDGDKAKIVRLTDGVAVTTDGPYAEAKESLIGFWVLDVADEARILEIAGRIVAYSRVVEVRPVGVVPDVA